MHIVYLVLELDLTNVVTMCSYGFTWCDCFPAPTGELVPARMVLQPDGDYKVEYSSRFTGNL